jgi:histidinol-phosphate aminotransferase
MKFPAAEHIRAISPYVPGKPIEELEREYGIHDSVKLASNENPIGPSPKAVAAIADALGRLHRYPDGGAYVLTRRLAEHLKVAPETIVFGNGSDEVLAMLARVLLSPGDEAVMPRPSFLMYEITVRTAGADCVFVPLKDRFIDLEGMAAAVTDRTRMVFVCNPNNPTGTIVTGHRMRAFLEAIPKDVVVVLDEAYTEFVRDPNCAGGLSLLAEGRPVVALRTFSKAYGLAGLRVGYGVMPAPLAELLHRVRMPFNVNSLAQAGALAAIEDQEFLQQTVAQVHRGLAYLFSELEKINVACFPTEANFFLIDLGKDADEVFGRLLEKGVIVRSMSGYGYPACIRVNVGSDAENRRLVAALKQVL